MNRRGFLTGLAAVAVAPALPAAPAIMPYACGGYFVATPGERVHIAVAKRPVTFATGRSAAPSGTPTLQW